VARPPAAAATALAAADIRIVKLNALLCQEEKEKFPIWSDAVYL